MQINYIKRLFDYRMFQGILYTGQGRIQINIISDIFQMLARHGTKTENSVYEYRLNSCILQRVDFRIVTMTFLCVINTL